MNELAAPIASSTPVHIEATLPLFLVDAQRASLEMIVKGAPLTDTLSELTRAVERFAENDAVAAILLVDEELRLWTGAAPSLPDEYNSAIDGLVARVGLGTCSEAAVLQQIVITPDIENDPNWATIKQLPLGQGLKAAWSQPIIGGNGRTLATFGTYFRTCREPTVTERQLVAVLAHTAALAIEKKIDEEHRVKERRVLERALEAAQMGTWRYTFDDNLCVCSPRAQELYGLSDPDWLHDEAGVRQVLHPDDIPLMWEKVQRAQDPAVGRYDVEYRVRRPEGGWRWISAWGIVEFDERAESPVPVALTGASRDITESKEAEAQQKLLVQELNHRVKNTLAVVQALASQTLRSGSIEHFQERFFARLGALSRTHSLISQFLWQSAPIGDIAEAVMEPFSDQLRNAIAVEGPPALIDPSRAVALCLVLHELATNALKYGSLTRPEGTVRLNWTLESTGSPVASRVRLRWLEQGGPEVHAPAHTGFGTRLINASAEQLGGSAMFSYGDVFSCEVTFPLNLPSATRH